MTVVQSYEIADDLSDFDEDELEDDEEGNDDDEESRPRKKTRT